MSPDHTAYQSPFSWRYGSPAMRAIWSELNKRKLWRRIWVAVAEIQADFGLVSPAQAAELRAHAEHVDIPRALQIEAEIHHDVMAEIRTFAEQCPLGGRILHLGMTSMDVVDNADALRVRASLDVLLPRAGELLLDLCALIERHASLPVMAFTHLQPAEPTTLGYRLAQYAQDLLADWEALSRARAGLKGKGLKGAVGVSASFAELIGLENLPAFESRLSERLDLPFFPVATQTYPRKQDYQILSDLAGLAATLHKFAFDLRILQTPAIGEWSEPFGEKQVGSSAMPFKRNPIHSEKIDSLARLLAQCPRLAWDNAAHSLLERTLDDSANRRTLLPESFLIADELLATAHKLIRGLHVDKTAIARNLAAYGPFAATERVLMALGKRGADRQAMHERLRIHAGTAWEAVRAGRPNPLFDLLADDPALAQYLSPDELRPLLDSAHYVGDAPARARAFARHIRTRLEAE